MMTKEQVWMPSFNILIKRLKIFGPLTPYIKSEQIKVALTPVWLSHMLVHESKDGVQSSDQCQRQ